MASLATSNPGLSSKKRRFQPPITTYFPTTPDASSPFLSHNHYSAPTSSATPVVSAKDQASLLHVGMRIRKAVPEGYKTKPVEKMSSGLCSSRSLQNPGSGNANMNGNGGAVYTELAPFSGMSKSGGDQRPVESLSNTSVSASAFSSALTTDDGDAFSLPSSSQTSTLSTSSSSSSSSSGLKRAADAEIANPNDEPDSDSCGDVLFHDGSPVGRLSLPAPILNRPILAPSVARQRQVLAAQLDFDQTPAFGTANANAVMDVDDFEEPEFLQRREDIDAEYLPRQGRLN